MVGGSALEAESRLPVVQQVAESVHRVLEQRGGGRGVHPTSEPTNGMTWRAETIPASFPTKLRYLSAFMAFRGAVSTNG
jgi:hypothetical protein